MPGKPPPPKSKPKLPASKAPTPGRQKAERTVKSFSIAPLSGAGEGEKLLVYGKSGLGKTTLAAQLPNAVFIPLDDGARKVHNPLTGEPVQAISGVDTWDDLRDAVKAAVDLLPKGGVLVIDTITRAQPLAEQWVVDNVPLEKGGTAKNLEAFGFGKGYRFVLDQFRLLLSDLDTLIRSGRSVVLLAQLDQSIVPNPAGVDYYEEVPKLIENKQGPVRTEVCEWVDHVIRLGFIDVDVVKDDVKSRAGKVTGDGTRGVFAGGAQHFIAKSRPINGNNLPPVISYETPADNALWQFVFEGATLEETQ